MNLIKKHFLSLLVAIWHEMKKKRYVSSYKTKKRLLAVFLITVDVFIWWNVANAFFQGSSVQSDGPGLQSETYSQSSQEDHGSEGQENQGEENAEPEIAPANPPSPLDEITQKIRDTFPEDPDMAVAIATCESTLEMDAVGDSSLAVYDHNGEFVGESYGLFQIRSGEARPGRKYWNRAQANGMTVEEFKNWMKDPNENINYARAIYDRAEGWGPWSCKNVMV